MLLIHALINNDNNDGEIMHTRDSAFTGLPNVANMSPGEKNMAPNRFTIGT